MGKIENASCHPAITAHGRQRYSITILTLTKLALRREYAAKYSGRVAAMTTHVIVSPCFPTRASASQDCLFVLIGSHTMARRTEKAKMLAGEVYRATGPEIAADAMGAD